MIDIKYMVIPFQFNSFIIILLVQSVKSFGHDEKKIYFCDSIEMVTIAFDSISLKVYKLGHFRIRFLPSPS